MRASRLLQMLLLLQNRGKMTTRELATALEVARRTVLRDVEALIEAGLPITVHRGNRGGIELGFNYRTRLTGLAADEAEALAVMLDHDTPMLRELGMQRAAERAQRKLIESLPDKVRSRVQLSRQRFRIAAAGATDSALPAGQDTVVDERIQALALAIRGQRIVTICARSTAPRKVYPCSLIYSPGGWALVDAREPDTPIALAECEDINISSRPYACSMD